MIYVTGIIIPAVLAVSLEGRPVTDVSPPCFVNDDDVQLKENYPLAIFLPKIGDQILELKARVEERRAKMENLCKPSADASFIDKRLNAMKYEQTVLLNNLGTNQILIIKAIHEHYNMLNTFALYLQEIQKTALDITSRKSLLSIQKKLYNVMCVMKTVLRRGSHDPDNKVPSGQLSNYFYENIKYLPNNCLQQQLEYVIIHDCEQFIRFLELYYSNIIQLNSNTK